MSHLDTDVVERDIEGPKEGAMLRLLLSLTPAGLVHHLGTGRALDNACRDHIEQTLTLAEVDAMVGRIPAAHEELVVAAAARTAA
jgi:hypothetical protein